MTALDHRLYAWLAEPDDRRFEPAFSAYFTVAFPAVVRHLSRLSRWDGAELEELAQDALLRFFDRVGRRRREASEAVGYALVNLRPLALGPFHTRQVSSWTHGVSAFRNAAMSFRPTPDDESGDAEWKASIRTLTERIPLLQKQGCHLVHAVQLELKWQFEHCDADAINAAAIDDEDTDAQDIGRGAEIDSSGALDVVQRLAKEVAAKSAQAVGAEQRYVGFTSFVEGSHTVITRIPLLRVPTNGYLFEIAMTIYLDECKKRGRKKRGGLGLPEADGSGPTPDAPSDPPHPLESMALDALPDFDPEEIGARPARGHAASAAGPVSDPTRRYEDEEFLEKFYQYLRRPLDEASDALERAQAAGHGVTERRRKWESVAQKFERTVAVLTLLGEGYTQDESAARLGLSRNQVKYVIELVQESYASFAAGPTRLSPGSPTMGEQSHVP